MPRLDIYHDQVKRALEKDGWLITHDPFPLTMGKKRMFADLGAETLLSAEKEQTKIVVEIKSFTGVSVIKDLEQALGQYTLYQRILEVKEPERILYLAVTTRVAREVFEVELGQLLLDTGSVRILVFDAEQEVITQWLPN
ncbi:MAG: XisH family protein [Candidatus Thiothrix moscowensis]|nr:XisH family protein [Candidatus Thiothrix moscowensis]